MKTFDVSLIVHHPSLSLDELSAALGRPHSSGSHGKGETRVVPSLPAWSKTVWRFDSGAPQSVPPLEHLQSLEKRFPPHELLALLPPDSQVYVDIACFFDTFNAGISIPAPGMEIINRYRAYLEITCYPSNFDT
jgi:hypothetical protein